MKRFERFKRKLNNFFYDHYILKAVLREIRSFLIGAVAAFLFAFGFSCFILPVQGLSTIHFATGGVSGISQNIALIVNMCGGTLTDAQLNAIGYTCINIPILIFAFIAIGKRFAIQSALNVGLSSLFLILVPKIMNGDLVTGVAQVGAFDAANGNFSGAFGTILIVRALFGGVFIGLSSALAFKGEFSCGGIDVITYYISMRKSTSVGKFGVAINIFVVLLYSVLSIINGFSIPEAIGQLLISIVYLLVVNIVIDMINLRNKKIKIEITTDNEHMGDILIANFPHAATSLKGHGVYSGAEKQVIWMIVSSSEVRNVIKLARKVDEHAFISVMSLVQVYGNFFIKPIN